MGFAMLVALGACKKNAPAPAVRPEPSASAAAAKQAPGACEAIDAHNEGAIAAGAKELDNAVKTGAIPSAWTVDRPPIEAPCFETAAGAWAKKITRIHHSGVTEAFWSLVHIGKDGRETSLEGSGDSPFYDVCCSPTRAVKRVMLFDFDGDGDPEIGFDVEAEGPEGDTSLYHHLYTFRDGAIKPYPVPFTGRLEDIDKDGRPDLIREHNEIVKTMCDAYEPVSGPAVIAHALPNGTFSTTDKVAADHAKKVGTMPARAGEAQGPFTQVDDWEDALIMYGNTNNSEDRLVYNAPLALSSDGEWLLDLRARQRTIRGMRTTKHIVVPAACAGRLRFFDFAPATGRFHLAVSNDIDPVMGVVRHCQIDRAGRLLLHHLRGPHPGGALPEG